jgi:hypothetical protein
MNKLKKISLMVSVLALLAAMPAFVAGQTAPAGNGGGGGGKPTTVPTDVPTVIPTATPVVDTKDCDGGGKEFHFKKLDHWDVTDRSHDFWSGKRDGHDHDGGDRD